MLSHVQLFATPWTITYQVTPSMAFSRQEYWSGLPFPSPGDLPDPGIKTQVSRIAGKCFTLRAPMEAHHQGISYRTSDPKQRQTNFLEISRIQHQLENLLSSVNTNGTLKPLTEFKGADLIFTCWCVFTAALKDCLLNYSCIPYPSYGKSLQSLPVLFP